MFLAAVEPSSILAMMAALVFWANRWITSEVSPSISKMAVLMFGAEIRMFSLGRPLSLITGFSFVFRCPVIRWIVLVSVCIVFGLLKNQRRPRLLLHRSKYSQT